MELEGERRNSGPPFYGPSESVRVPAIPALGTEPRRGVVREDLQGRLTGQTHESAKQARTRWNKLRDSARPALSGSDPSAREGQTGGARLSAPPNAQADHVGPDQ
jgi:hypothetical protein